MRTILSALFLIIGMTAMAQSVVGTWMTIDDETKKKKSLVKIYKKDGKLYGKVIKLYRTPEEDQDPSCTKCEDDRKGKKIIGMEVIRGLSYDSEDKIWEKGTILDPKKGKIYKAKLWLMKDKPKFLQVRGYVGFFYRTQTWVRVK